MTLAASSRRIPAGATREVRLRLRSTGRWLLRRSRRIPVRVVASGRAPGGAAVKVTRAATLTIR